VVISSKGVEFAEKFFFHFQRIIFLISRYFTQKKLILLTLILEVPVNISSITINFLVPIKTLLTSRVDRLADLTLAEFWGVCEIADRIQILKQRKKKEQNHHPHNGDHVDSGHCLRHRRLGGRRHRRRNHRRRRHL
jgi:hypothetical protein